MSLFQEIFPALKSSKLPLKKFIQKPSQYWHIKLELFVEIVRKRHPEVFYKKGAFKNFTKFTGKPLCWSFFFNKVAG